jgi:4-hydroxy-tetrahydrodipicolinate reductase
MARRLAVLGASGRMGRRVIACLGSEPGLELVAAVAHAGSAALGVDAGLLAGVGPCGVEVVAIGPGCFGEAEVVIDFSLPEGLLAGLRQLEGRALVSGVTGGGAELAAALEEAATVGPLLVAANFSTGVHVLAHAVRMAAAALPKHDVEIVEAHHRLKVDAPSGTALLLAQAVAEARGWSLEEHLRHGRSGRVGVRGEEIGMHALRGGDVVGEHTVWFAGEGERVMLGHVASSRDTFAHGALRSAAWLVGRPAGRYTMGQVLGLEG